MVLESSQLLNFALVRWFFFFFLHYECGLQNRCFRFWHLRLQFFINLIDVRACCFGIFNYVIEFVLPCCSMARVAMEMCLNKKKKSETNIHVWKVGIKYSLCDSIGIRLWFSLYRCKLKSCTIFHISKRNDFIITNFQQQSNWNFDVKIEAHFKAVKA